MTVPWACNAGVELVVGDSTCSVNSFPRPSCVRAKAVQRSDQVVLIIIKLLFGAQQTVLGRDTPCLDSPKCMVLCLPSNAGYLKETNSEYYSNIRPDYSNIKWNEYYILSGYIIFRLHSIPFFLSLFDTLIFQFVWFILRPCQHDDGYIYGQSQIKVHTDERTQVHSTWSSLMVTHPCTNRGWRCLTSVNVPLS